MRGVACGVAALLAVLAPRVRADARVDRMTDHLSAGRTEKALDEASPEVMDLLAIAHMGRPVVHAMVAHNERHAAKDGPSCDRVLKLAKKIRERALAAGNRDARILAAEVLVLEGRTSRARKEQDWFKSWRAAAEELAAWHGGSGGRDRALVRAVQILSEGAQLKGAPPAAEILEEARKLVLLDPRGESDASPAFLAFRVCLAEHHCIARRKAPAAQALAPFEDLAAKLGGRDEDLERATIFNLAVALSRREGLGLKAPFRTTEERAAKLVFDLPVSYLWSEPREDWLDGAYIDQVAPDGRLLRDLYVNWYEPGVPWDHDTPEPKTLQRLAELRIGAIRDFEMTKNAKSTGPQAGTLNRSLPRGLLATFEGVDSRGREVASRHHLFEEKKRAPGRFEASIRAFGRGLPEDPLFDAVVASIR